MRQAARLLLLAAALFFLSGPVFGAVVLVSGGDLHIRGGWIRLALDIAVGVTLLAASSRRIGEQQAAAAA